MGKASRVKGSRGERLFVSALKNNGIEAERIPLSGLHGGSFSGDVSVPVLGVDRKFECKLRRDSFKEIYKWLGNNFGLFLKADRKDPLVVLRLSDFIDMVQASDAHKDALPVTAVLALEKLLRENAKARKPFELLQCLEAA